MLKLTSAHYSNAGARSSNEDALGVRIRAHDACFVLSDGVGGERGGRYAAKLAVHAVLTQFELRSNEAVAELAQHCIATAHAAIVADQASRPGHSRMAATLIGLFIDRRLGIVQWVHAGDSRLYHFRRGKLRARTTDHSLVEQLAAAGLPHEQVNPHLLSLALGRAMPAAAQATAPQHMEDGDAFLLCTDGFWHELRDEVLESCLQIAGSVEDWTMLLSHQVAARGTKDNHSAIAIWVGDPRSITISRTLTSQSEVILGIGVGAKFRVLE